MSDDEPILLESKLKEYTFSTQIDQDKYTYRILKMKDSVFIYIGQSDNQIFDELATGLMTEGNKKDILATTLMGPHIGCESQDLSRLFASKLKKQVFISCNIPAQKQIRPALVKRLVDEIHAHPEVF